MTGNESNHANVDPDLCRHVASLGHRELNVSCDNKTFIMALQYVYIGVSIVCCHYILWEYTDGNYRCGGWLSKKQITAEQFANYFASMLKQVRVDKKYVRNTSTM